MKEVFLLTYLSLQEVNKRGENNIIINVLNEFPSEISSGLPENVIAK